MSRHSKNNTASAVFTYAERKALKDYGTQELRLGKDSILAFHHCFLCLNEGIERDNMVVCTRGHVACKECQLRNILSQKLKHRQKLEEFNREKKSQETREKILQNKLEEQQELKFKRKHDIMRTGEAEKKNHNRLDANRIGKEEDPINSSSLSSSSFWIDNDSHCNTSSNIIDSSPILKIECQGGSSTTKHPLSISQLFSVHLRLDCPMCNKSFLNNVIKVLVIKSCGHLICKDCIKRTKQCALCNGPIDETIEIFKDGTGFAGGGDKIVASKGGIAFSC